MCFYSGTIFIEFKYFSEKPALKISQKKKIFSISLIIPIQGYSNGNHTFQNENKRKKKQNSLVIILLKIAVIENRYFVVTEQIRIFIHFCVFFVINNQFYIQILTCTISLFLFFGLQKKKLQFKMITGIPLQLN